MNRRRGLQRVAAFGAAALVATACAGAGSRSSGPDDGPSSDPLSPQEPTTSPGSSVVRSDPAPLPDSIAPLAEVWETDFATRTIDLSELALGIPALDPRDLIRPIDDPVFEPVSEAAGWLDGREPGVVVDIGDAARFYPLRILTRHEIVNDRFDDLPVAVTYCPLCNTALVFDRRVGADTLRFGVSGLLRNSDLVMWDDLTESLWQQITGEAIVGSLAGTELTTVGSAIVRWSDFAAAHPEGQSLSLEQGFGIPYGANPYVGYSSRSAPYPFFEGEIDDRFPALERVVGVSAGTADKAYPFSRLREERVVNDVLDGIPVVVMWGAEDTADALDSARIPAGQPVGTGVAYLAELDGQALTFTSLGEDRFADEQTGSTWSLLGRALDGPLEGSQLLWATHRNEFWFAWQAFFPDGVVHGE